MCQFETPVFIYYAYSTVFLLSLVTGLIILLKNPRHSINRNAFYFILVIILWIINDFIQWVLHDVGINMFLGRISYLASFVNLFFLFFAYHFTYTPISKKKKLIISIPYLIAVAVSIFADIKYVNPYFDVRTCNVSDAGPIIFYLYLLGIIYSVWATFILLRYYRNRIIPMVTRSQIKVLISAIWFFVGWNIFYEEIGRIGFLNGYFSEISPHFILGNLFFVSLIAFAIIKKDLFELNNVLTCGFTIAIWTLTFLIALFFHMGIVSSILAIVSYSALMLIFWKM